MLEQARVRASEAGVDLDLRLGDMRDLELAEPAARPSTRSGTGVGIGGGTPRCATHPQIVLGG
jgi:hypothetical protein